MGTMILRKTLNSSHIANAHTSANGHKTKYMSIRPQVLYGSDFETNIPKDGKVNVWLWSIVRASDLTYICGESIEEWYNEIMKLTGIVCFHNLKFDGQFIMDYLIRNNIPFDREHTIIDAEMHIPYRIALKEDLFIQDTMRVHNGKLEKVAESYGIDGKSKPADFTKYHEYGSATDEEIEYVIQDSRIVAQILKMDCETNDGYIPLTAAGYAKRQFVNYLKKSGLVKTNGLGKGMGDKADDILNQLFPYAPENPHNTDWQDLSRCSYMGGLCLVKSGKESEVNGKTYVYDVNSAYPFQMASKYLPVGKGMQTTEYDPDKFGIYWVTCEFDHDDKSCPIIHQSRMFIPHVPPSITAIEPMFDLYGQSDYIGKFFGDLVLTSIEIEYLKEYADLDILDLKIGYTFETRNDIFGPYIREIYEHRQDIKEIDLVLSEFLKVMMNALYGKFGSAEKFGIEYEIDDNNLYHERVVKDEVDTPWCYVPVATAITGYERVYIAEIISKNWDGFLYTDTDSIHLSKPHKDGSMRIDQRELGALKCESISEFSKYLRPKCYVHENETEYDNKGNVKKVKPISVKCGGMPDNIKKTIHSKDELFIGAKFKGKLVPKKYVGGVYLQPTEFKLNDSYRM